MKWLFFYHIPDLSEIFEKIAYKEREKLDVAGKNSVEQRKEPITNSTHIWCHWNLNLGENGERQVTMPLHSSYSHKSFQCQELSTSIFSLQYQYMVKIKGKDN